MAIKFLECILIQFCNWHYMYIRPYCVGRDHIFWIALRHGPLVRYVKLRVAHAPRMPGTFPRHRGLAIPTFITARVTHVPWYMPGSLTRGFLWSRWRRKRSRHSRCMRNPHFCVCGKRPIHMDVPNTAAIHQPGLTTKQMTNMCDFKSRRYIPIYIVQDIHTICKNNPRAIDLLSCEVIYYSGVQRPFLLTSLNFNPSMAK